MNDRVGISWRPELAAAIMANLDRIDALEAMADDWLDVPVAEMRALRALCATVPVTLHGVSLGLASSEPVARTRLDAFARLVDAVHPAGWSEHLSFVRAGGIEIGHLAAPPRTAGTAASAAANLALATTVVGMAPDAENIATLIDPPGSDRDEAQWIGEALAPTRCGLLLDLHNLHANAVNFGGDARATLERLPLDRLASVHLAGGRWNGRLVDDHLHAVPDEVFALLERVGELAPRPITVI
ncbi:MAG: DUF692 family protein, partial [Planctomycetes bacterium]|nr:DUF692 family protein [Planctomycetota bacterium]